MDQDSIHILLNNLGICLVLVVSIIVLSSCSAGIHYPALVRSALQKAGANRQQLVRVIQHYSKDPADSLKLMAAYFLISNMPGHRYEKPSPVFDAVFDSAAAYQNRKKSMKYFKHEMTRIRRKQPAAFYRDSMVKDINRVTSHFLIRNINLAFKAWHRMPQKYRTSFRNFKRYVLPYRASNEALAFGNREKQLKKYQWVYQKLQSGQSMRSLINSVLDSMNIQFFNHDGGYPGLFPISQVERLGYGRCNDGVDYAVSVFRAIGIPASYVFISHWGNHPSGHSWLAIHSKDTVIALNVFDRKPANRMYWHESVPKVYRYTYGHRGAYPHFSQDVTSNYKPSNKIHIANRFGSNLQGKQIYLTVFDRLNGWYPAALADYAGRDSVAFQNIGENIVYIAGYYDPSHRLHPVNYPFIVNSRQHVHYFNPAVGGRLDSVVLLRKYPPFFLRTDEHKLLWTRRMNGLELQASNVPLFAPHHTILTIHGFHTTHLKTIPLSYEGKYKYYRFLRPDTEAVWLAKLHIQSNQKIVKTAASDYHGKMKMHHLTDKDQLTYSGGPGFEVRYVFSRPAKIQAIQLQTRNDDNHIDVGDRYELMYWNKGWQSLGVRIAKDTMLVYHNLPKNAIYWLRDLSKGVEEDVFTLTDKGTQWWPGISIYEDSLDF